MSRAPTEKEHAFLCMLAAGKSFEQAAAAMGGDDEIRVPWQCLLNGWINQGQITKEGRELVLGLRRTTKFEITILPPGASALTPGKTKSRS